MTVTLIEEKCQFTTLRTLQETFSMPKYIGTHGATNDILSTEQHLAILSWGISEALEFYRYGVPSTVFEPELDVLLFNVFWEAWARDNRVSTSCRDLLEAGQGIRTTLSLMLIVAESRLAEAGRLLIDTKAKLRSAASEIISRKVDHPLAFQPWRNVLDGVTSSMLIRLYVIFVAGIWYALNNGLLSRDVAMLLALSGDSKAWCKSFGDASLTKVISLSDSENTCSTENEMRQVISAALHRHPYKWARFDPAVSTLNYNAMVEKHYIPWYGRD